MSRPESTGTGSARAWISTSGPLVLTIVILGVAIAFAIGSWQLGGRPARFPLSVAVITIVLCVLEIIHELFVSAKNDEDSADAAATLSASGWERIVAVVWFFLTMTAVYLFGVLPAAFVSSAAYYRWNDRRSRPAAIVAGVAATVALWLVFEFLAGFTLYRGRLL